MIPTTPSRRSLLAVALLAVIGSPLDAPVAASASYQQDPGPDGAVWIEAAALSSSAPGPALAWQVSADRDGEARLVLAPREAVEVQASSEAPRVTYRIIFTKDGPHYLWVHGHRSGGGTSLDAGLDGDRAPACRGIRLPAGSAGWVGRNATGAPATFTVPTPGEYELSLWGGEAGTILDRILVTSAADLDPATLVSARRPRLVAHYTRLDSGEAWEALERVGPHADVVVRLPEIGGTLVFGRGSSYLPFWETSQGRWFVDEVIPRRGDGAGLRPDRTNLYARATIIESTPARAVVRWRYVPDLSNPGFAGWAEEYFAVYPDGTCVRSLRRGTPTLREWEDPASTEVRSVRLTGDGIVSRVPGPPSATLALSRASADAYVNEGAQATRGSHALRCREPGRPTPLNVTVDPGPGGAVQNPVIEVRDWGDAAAVVTAGGEPLRSYEAGHVGHMDGTDLVLWLDLESRGSVEISIEPVGGSGPLSRAPAPEPYGREVPDLPEGSPDPGPFGAYYTHLRYFEEWDEPWRVGPDADVVVQFDDGPHRFVFWRGADYVPHWVNDANHWYNNEFVERRAGDSGLEGCCAEPMQDHEARYSSARIIASHDARAVVHWRYAPSDRNYDVAYVDETGWGDRVDEYYYVYPDAVAVREVTLYTSAPHRFNEWHEAIPLVNPGKIPEDVLEMKAIALTDVEGRKRVYSWQDGFPKTLDDGRNIMLVGLKGSTRPFVVVEPRGVWVDEISLPDESRFNHYDDWPGWPASRRGAEWDRNPDTGYREFWKILPSHSSLMHFMWDDYAQDLAGPVKWKTKIMLHGLTAGTDVDTLIPLARSWETPPSLRLRGSGYRGGGYDKVQRAYRVEKISGDPRALEATLEASPASPLVNLALVVEGWPAGSEARLLLDGEAVPRGPRFRQGIERTPDGGTALVVWIATRSTSPLNVEVTPP